MNYFCSIFFLFRHWGLYQPIGYNGSYLFKSYFPFSNLTTTRAKWVLNTKSAVFAAICQPKTRNTRIEEEKIASYFDICLSVLLYVCPLVCSFFCLSLSFCLCFVAGGIKGWILLAIDPEQTLNFADNQSFPSLEHVLAFQKANKSCRQRRIAEKTFLCWKYLQISFTLGIVSDLAFSEHSSVCPRGLQKSVA